LALLEIALSIFNISPLFLKTIVEKELTKGKESVFSK
jgi:hypothetical protein